MRMRACVCACVRVQVHAVPPPSRLLLSIYVHSAPSLLLLGLLLVGPLVLALALSLTFNAHPACTMHHPQVPIVFLRFVFDPSRLCVCLNCNRNDNTCRTLAHTPRFPCAEMWLHYPHRTGTAVNATAVDGANGALPRIVGWNPNPLYCIAPCRDREGGHMTASASFPDWEEWGDAALQQEHVYEETSPFQKFGVRILYLLRVLHLVKEGGEGNGLGKRKETTSLKSHASLVSTYFLLQIRPTCETMHTKGEYGVTIVTGRV